MLYQVILHSITVITIIFQFYLFYLIRYKSPKSMASYTFYLNYYTGFDLLFTIVMGCFLQPDPTGVLMSFRVYGISSYIGPRAEIIAAALVFYTGANMFISQLYCFLYRYASLHNKQMHDMFATHRTKFFLFTISQVFCLVVFCLAYGIMVSPEEFFNERTQNQVLLQLRDHINPGEFVLMPIITSWVPRFFMLFTLMFFMCSEIFSVYVIHAILSTLKKNTTKFSKNTYKLHMQLTLLLTVQLTIPLVLIVFPISIRWITFLITGNELVSFHNFRMTLVTLYGITNTLFAIIFITPYRSYTYNTFIFPILLPIAKTFNLNGWMPRRKSITIWASGTNIRRVDCRQITAKNSVFTSD